MLPRARQRHVQGPWPWVAAVLTFSLFPVGTARADQGILLQLDRAGRLSVTETTAAAAGDGTRPGLFLWAEQGRDRCRFFGAGEETAAGAGSLPAPLPIPPAHLPLRPALVAPFPATPPDRAAAFLTPGDGQTLLQPYPTFRRLPRAKGSPFPPAAAVLTRAGRTILRIPFRNGQERVALADLPELPADLKEGLPPGAYCLQMEGEAAITFVVAEPGRRAAVMKPVDELAGMLENRTDPLFLQVAAEHLLAQRDDKDNPRPYLADALDVLESVPAERLPPYLRELHQRLLSRLGLRPGTRNARALAPDEATGIAAIDRARQLLAAGRWADALAVLRSMKPEDTAVGRRAAGLAALYRGEIVAESGLETEGPAERFFEQALALLAEGTAADQYRAHNEYADFLLGRVEERLSDQAAETAAGVPHPLVTALQDWCAARREYDTARQLAERLGPVPRTVVGVNLARSYALLADLIRTLDPPVGARFVPHGPIRSRAICFPKPGAGREEHPLETREPHGFCHHLERPRESGEPRRVGRDSPRERRGAAARAGRRAAARVERRAAT
jgi:hypothetical protein